MFIPYNKADEVHNKRKEMGNQKNKTERVKEIITIIIRRWLRPEYPTYFKLHHCQTFIAFCMYLANPFAIERMQYQVSF